MIYGEGGKQAFFRLQEQIMKTTRDDSILAWSLSDEITKPAMNDKGQVIGGEVLAAGPSSFATSAQIVAREQSASPLHSLDIVGGSVRLYLPLLTTSGGETYGLLSCGPRSDKKKVVGIPLVRANPGASSEYIRPVGCPLVLQPINSAPSPPELIHIKRDGQRVSSSAKHHQYWIYDDDLFAQVNLALVDVEPPSCWDEQMNLISAVRSDDDTAERVFLRFRHGEEGSRDFVIVLEVTAPAINNDSPFHVVTCSRDTPLLELVENYVHILSKASGRISASNGTLHLRISLELIEEGLMSINPHSMDRRPDVTIDVSSELEKLYLVTKFKQLLRNRRQGEEKEEELRVRIKLHKDRLQLVQKEREAVEDQMRQLEEKRRKLVVEEDDRIREIQVAEHEHESVNERQGDILKQLSQVNDGLAKLQLFDDAKAGEALIKEVETHGDTEVFRLFDDQTAEALMMNKYGTPLTPACRGGDANLVRQPLATSEIGIDHKDSKFGRTALGYASANGHEAVEQLLLDTDQVDVNLTYNDGRSPLRRVSRRIHAKRRLLMNGNAGIGCHLTIQSRNDVVSTLAVAAVTHDSESCVSGLPGSPDNATTTYDSSTCKCQGAVEDLYAGVKSVAFPSDSKFIAAGLNDGTVNVWNSTTGEPIQTIKSKRQVRFELVAFSHNPDFVVTCSSQYKIEIWDLRTGKRLYTFGAWKEELCLAISPHSRLVASGSSYGTVKIWERTRTAEKRLRELQNHRYSVHSVVFSHDSRFIASGSSDGTVRIWDVETGECLETFNGHERRVNSVVFSHDSTMIASASADKTVKIWNVGTGMCQRALQGHRDGVNSVAISHDSGILVSGSSDKTIRIWDAKTGQCLRVLEGHSTKVSSVALSHDSTRVASGSDDGTIKIWNMSILLTMLPASGVDTPTSTSSDFS
jgi:WD40 repeat protein